jgi:asparagine synthase (glutamine-hydrolysing)
MCGVAGIITPEVSAAHVAQIGYMLEAQKHRGPDSKDCAKLDSRVIFGHNRLSIIDLSEDANQPFFDVEKRFSLVFNGEIYNYLELRKELEPFYSFKTNSDTEVLLAAYIHWGVQALDRFLGMFAFAIYDLQTREVFIARDRFGVKPFYYAFGEKGSFYFASEIKSLHAAAIPKEKNEELWASFLVRGTYSHKDQTFWSGIFSLEAGHYVKCHIDELQEGIQSVRWYHFVDRINRLRSDREYARRNFDSHLKCYKKLLEDSIRLRFRADVPVGFNISGGLDSSLLLSVVDALFKDVPVEAFSFYCDDDRYDELAWVEEIIAHTNKPLNKVLLRASEVPGLAKKNHHFQDEPYGGIPTIAYSRVFEAASKRQVTVLLDGNGIDEAWAGYDYYHKDSESIVQGVRKSPLMPEVLSESFLNKAIKESYPAPFKDALLNKQYRDLFHTKLPRSLRFNDRVSMMHSTELREPFLDHRLVEYAFALPVDMKMRNKEVKWALRELTGTYLNNELVFAPKRPLQTPQREWLTENLIEWVETRIASLSNHPWFDESKLKAAWSEFKLSDKENTFFLWQWLSVAESTVL